MIASNPPTGEPFGRRHLVAHRRQLCADQSEQRGLHLQPVVHLVVAEARHVAGRLHVGAEIQDVHEHLHVALALLIAAVLARHEQRPIAARHEHRR